MITAIIPARAGSKGLPGKNIKTINGKPLIVWSIEQALCARLVDEVIVSTDSEQIAEIALRAGAKVPSLRPSYLAQDETATEPVMQHVVKEWCSIVPRAVLLLQPTSPLRLPGKIDLAIQSFVEQTADSLLSVVETHAFFWRNIESIRPLYDYEKRPRRQDLLASDKFYRENGSIYITKTEVLFENNNRLGGKIVPFIMDECESFEIDTEIDYLIVEQLMKAYFL